jgi:GAF domain-containing protein
MAIDLPPRPRPEPPVASSARLGSAVEHPARLAALASARLVDQAPEPVFDRFARIAARLVDAPVAAVSLVTDDRQCFIGMCGVRQPWADARQMPLSHSLCQHVVANAAPRRRGRAHRSGTVREPAVIDLGVVAYAGFPIVGSEGHVLGSLCAIDDKPRSWITRISRRSPTSQR